MLKRLAVALTARHCQVQPGDVLKIRYYSAAEAKKERRAKIS